MGGGGTTTFAEGGELYVEGPGPVVNSTFFENVAAGPTSSLASGGGIEMGPVGTLTLASDTLDGNDAADFGGNIDVQGGGQAVANATGTIFANGFAPNGDENCGGVVTDLAPFHNLEFFCGSATSQCGLSATN